MSRIHAELPHKDFEMPSDIQRRTICTESGLLATESCPSLTEYFAPGTIPNQTCAGHAPEEPEEEEGENTGEEGGGESGGGESGGGESGGGESSGGESGGGESGGGESGGGESGGGGGEVAPPTE